MRSYLARRDVRRMLFVRYTEDGNALSTRWWQPDSARGAEVTGMVANALCRGLEEVQNFLSGIVLGLTPYWRTSKNHFNKQGHFTFLLSLVCTWESSPRFYGCWQRWPGFRAGPQRRSSFPSLARLLLYAVQDSHFEHQSRSDDFIMIGGFFFERKKLFYSIASRQRRSFFSAGIPTSFSPSTGFQLSFGLWALSYCLPIRSSGFCSVGWQSIRSSCREAYCMVRASRCLHSGYEWLCHGNGVSLAPPGLARCHPLAGTFHLVTPISLLANLVVVPIAFFVLAIALLSLLSTPLLPWLAVIFNNANWALATLVIGTVHLFAQIPGGHFYVGHPHMAEKVIAKITILDLGAGAAIHLHTKNTDWLFDCGSERSYQRVVHDYLHWAGVNRLSGLLLTHGDALHRRRTAQLLDDFPRVRVVDNPAPDRSTIHPRLQRLFQQRRIKTDALAAGDSFSLSRDVTANVLFPPRSFSSPMADDQAYVIHLLIGTAASMLFMSDSGITTERALLTGQLNLRSDIVVKGQHHFGESGSEAFLDAARPRLIIATSRDFPDHERISDAWAEQLQRRGIKLFRQDQTGAVILRFGRDRWEAQSYLPRLPRRNFSQRQPVKSGAPFWRKASPNLLCGRSTSA